ncbi:MAG: Ig-like domain-containing protein [bacterium]|jgi:uncharacterized protein (DUF2141 family)
MTSKHLHSRSSGIAHAAVVLGMLLLVVSCGQPMPPSGGPRDSLPPVLQRTTPVDSTRNFTGNRITLSFDEYVQVDNPFEKVSFSPIPKTKPLIEARLRNVSIRIKDTLEPNTTYSIDFGDAIRDINENNPLKGYAYVFSTGAVIDTASMSGRVIYAETGKTDSLMQVILHRDMDDSAVSKTKPRYMTRTDARGVFNFRFLAPGTYRIFAIKDADGGLKYDQASEYFGFADSVVFTGDTRPITLYAFQTESDDARKPAGSSQPAPRNKDDKRLKFSLNLEGERLDILGELVMTFESKLATWDSTRFQLTDEKFNPLPRPSLMPDSTVRKLTVRHTWSAGTKYRIILQKDFARDSAGNSIMRADTLKLESKKESDYGALNIRVKGLDTALRPVLLIYREDVLEKAQPLRLSRYTFKLFRPGDYSIRILYDTNGNGRWDTGDYWKKRQPERVNSRKQKLSIRPNWDNEFEIDLGDTGN